MKEIALTQEGFDRMSLELARLKNDERPAIASEIAEARSYGDLRENSEYSAAKEKQTMLEARIANLESIVLYAKIIDFSSIDASKVCFGTKVTMKNPQKTITVRIVSDYEANIDAGMIASTTPMAIALLGKEEGDEVKVGPNIYEITKIEI